MLEGKGCRGGERRKAGVVEIYSLKLQIYGRVNSTYPLKLDQYV
jgi:hypothetical protein